MTSTKRFCSRNEVRKIELIDRDIDTNMIDIFRSIDNLATTSRPGSHITITIDNNEVEINITHSNRCREDLKLKRIDNTTFSGVRSIINHGYDYDMEYHSFLIEDHVVNICCDDCDSFGVVDINKVIDENREDQEDGYIEMFDFFRFNPNDNNDTIGMTSQMIEAIRRFKLISTHQSNDEVMIDIML